jgi:hypothetical protein
MSDQGLRPSLTHEQSISQECLAVKKSFFKGAIPALLNINDIQKKAKTAGNKRHKSNPNNTRIDHVSKDVSVGQS